MKASLFKILAVLGVAGCAAPFSTVIEARQYLLENPNGEFAQEAFCVVAAAGESDTVPNFITVNLETPTAEVCSAAARTSSAAAPASRASDDAY